MSTHRSVLERKRGLLAPVWTVGSRFEAQWGARVARDVGGRIVLDESSVCVKHRARPLHRYRQLRGWFDCR